MGSFAILEHTADIGVRAEGATLEELFAQATRGLAAIIGIWQPGGGKSRRIDVSADDLGALLVDWLSEALYVHDTQLMAFTDVVVHTVRDGRAVGTLHVTPLTLSETEGTQVKAITYHDLSVERVGGRWVAIVYFDI
ncbi:MAG: archease [Vicinamibacteraceae bacterium]